jgi:signal transduction histidine kinase
LWWPLFLLALIAAAVYGLFWLIFRDGAEASVLASLVTVWFHFYGDYNWALWAWTLVFAVLGALVVVLGRPRVLGAVALGLAIWAVVLVVSPTSKIVRYERDNPGLSSSYPNVWPTSLATPTVPSGARKQDIYILCPDDYARHDVLAHYFHYDNGAFLRQLERRGFVVSPESRSPYSDSESNIAAEMNMDYLTRLPRILGSRSEDSRPVRRLIQDNRASRILKQLGYRYIRGWPTAPS